VWLLHDGDEAETLQEVIAWRQRQWQHWLEHEVSPSRQAEFAVCTPAAMLACLKIKQVVDRADGRILYATSDMPRGEITEEIVAGLMAAGVANKSGE
jgi:hypothetical protein